MIEQLPVMSWEDKATLCHTKNTMQERHQYIQIGWQGRNYSQLGKLEWKVAVHSRLWDCDLCMDFEEKGRTLWGVPPKKEQRNCSSFLNTVRLSSQQPCAAHPTLESGFGNCHNNAWHDGYTNRYPIPLVEELRSRVTWSGCKPHLLLTEEDMGSWANIGRSFLTLWWAMVSPIHHNWEDGDKDPVESIIAASQADIGAGDNRHSKHCPTIREWFSIRVF